MALSANTRLGVYEIVSILGAGGMGEVYRARDKRLNRDVALKILPEAFAADPERMARFTREAQTLAALNHPHIAQIYGLEEVMGVRALVMELVEGQDLAARIAQGAIPVDEALPIARQIAEALEAAHEQGIIHRDLKPANIKVRPDGTVKVLDFGLAKALEPPAHGRPHDVTQSPTITSPAMTQAGMVLGTAAYMSPEQAKGRPLDKRTDVWSFGAVLYEMLAGQRPFKGEDIADTIAAVLRQDMDWSALPAATPVSVRRLLERCLHRDAKHRLRDIGEARILLGEPDAVSNAADLRTVVPISDTPMWRRALPWALAATLAAGLVAVLVFRTGSPAPPVAPPLRLTVKIGADVSLSTVQGVAASLSRDGQTLVFVAGKTGGTTQLYIRRLGQLVATPLSGTDGAFSPFFSPDGQWIAFFAGGKLRKVSVNGGSPLSLTDTPGRAGTWADDGMITFSSGNRSNLLRLSSEGGTPEALTTLGEGQATHRWPQILPGGTAVLFTAGTRASAFDDANLEVQLLSGGVRKVVQRGAYYGRYLPSGHLIYMHDGTLFAVTFDLHRLEVTSAPVAVQEVIGTGANTAGSAPQFDVSDNGTLVYLTGRNNSVDLPIDWLDREGQVTTLRGVPANWSNLRFAPDGRRLAMDLDDGTQTDVWTYDWQKEALTRVTSAAGGAEAPAWTPDGRRIVFRASGGGTALNLHWQLANGTGPAQRLTESTNPQAGASWHPGGKFLAFQELNPQTQDDVLVMQIAGDEASGWKPGTPSPFIKTPNAERGPAFSPDGRWLAYSSTESGRDEIYVVPYPGGGHREQISTGGGMWATWSSARNELFFAAPDRRIMVAAYTVKDDVFRADKARPWSEVQFAPRRRTGPTRSFDLHPDGNRFAMATVTGAEAPVQQDTLVLVFNFFDELRRLVPLVPR